MNIEEYAQDLLQDIHAESDADGQFLEDVFFEKACDQLTEAGELDTADRVFYKVPARGIRVDGYGGDPVDSSGALSLIILDFHVSEKIQRVTGSEMDTLFRRLSNFLQSSLKKQWRDALEETNPAFGLADLIAQRWRKISKVRLLLVSNRALSERVDGRSAGDLDGRQITYSVWDIRRLHGYAVAGEAREDMEIDLVRDFGGPLPVLRAQHIEGQYESYLSVVPGEVLADIYDRWGARLLEQNVRVFLQARGKVNRGIRLTLENEPSMFFAYNNGITATAEAIEISDSSGQLLLNRLINFQIVNGGQTTASIHVARLRDTDISDMSVQMKLSVVSADRATTLVPKISEYANSQNRVNAADFFANHPFHVRMEEFSRRIHAPAQDGSFRQSKWFYERARGQYADAKARLTPAQRKKFEIEYPRKQLFAKTDLAKFINVWEGRPHEVSLGAQKNFGIFAVWVGKAWAKSSDDFNEAWFRQAVAKAIVFRSTERIVSSQPWYQGGYRANIVAYTIAKIAHEVGKNYRAVNFESIWKSQALGHELSNSIALAAKQVHDSLVNPPSGISNVTEWAKKEGCWARIQEISMELPLMLSEELISVDEKKDADKDARIVQKQLNGIQAQIAVVKAGGNFWEDALKWGSSRNLLTPSECGILEVATRIPQSTPTEKQSAKAIEALSKLRGEGYQAELDVTN